MQNQKGFFQIIAILIGVVVIAAGGVYYVIHKSSVTIIVPNGGEKLETGKSYEIQWEARNPDNAPYSIWLKKLGGGDFLIVDDYPGDKRSYLWQIPEAKEIMGGGEYVIEIVTHARYKTFWSSDNSDSSFTITLSLSELAEWKTYRNEQMGFEIKYPSEDWGIISESDTDITINNVLAQFGSPYWASFTVKISKQTLDDYIADYNRENEAFCRIDPETKESIVKIGDFMLGGVKGTRLKACTAIGYDKSLVFARKNNKSYIIKHIPGKAIHDQMLSSFKFAD